MHNRYLQVRTGILVIDLDEVFFPSFEEGALRPINKCHATLKQGAAGEVRHA